MYCCFRGKKPRDESRGDGVTAVNEDYIQWSSQDRVNGILRDYRQRGAAVSQENLYIDPDEVPKHLRLHQPQPQPPPPHAGVAGGAIGGCADSGELVYAELETGALTQAATDVAAAAAAATSAPPQLAQPPPVPPMEPDDPSSIIYSDIVGVLRP